MRTLTARDAVNPRQRRAITVSDEHLVNQHPRVAIRAAVSVRSTNQKPRWTVFRFLVGRPALVSNTFKVNP